MKAIPCVSRKPLSVTNTLPKASVSPVYDDNGNLTSDGRWAYTWDGENRLSTMTTTTAAQSAGVPYCKLVFGYDWMGRRLRKLIYNISSPGADPSEDQRFLYDGWNLFTEYSVGGSGLALKRSYTWGLDLSGSEQGAGGVGGLRAVRVKNGSTFTTYAPCYDGNGNIVAWVNHVTGAVESRQEYDPFGNRILQEGTEFPIGFSTKYEDRETGLLYYGYRYYDPVTGRWPNRDPIGERGGNNLYFLIENNPIGWIDILGLVKNCCCVDNVSIDSKSMKIKVHTEEPSLTNAFEGHQFTINIKMEFELVPDDAKSCECVLEWWEWSTNPLPYGKKQAKTWQNGAIDAPGAGTLKPWFQRKPYQEDVSITDIPSINSLNEENFGKTRELYILVRVNSGSGCDCKNKSKEVKIYQKLTLKDGGAGIGVVDTDNSEINGDGNGDDTHGGWPTRK